MTDPSTDKPGNIDDLLISVINAVLDYRIPAIDFILKEEGIPEIDIPDRSENDTTAMELYTPLASHIPSSPVSYGSSTSEPTNYATPFTDVDSYRAPRLSSTVTSHSQYYSSVSPAEDLPYARLLDNIVLTARSTIFPEFGPFNMSVMFDVLPDGGDVSDGVKTYYGSTDWENRRMIGAAGELFVSRATFIFTHPGND